MMSIQSKLIAWAGALGLLAMLLAGAAFHFEARGRAAADVEWLAKMNSLRAAYAQKDAADQLRYQRIERETSEQHETELAALRRDRDIDRRRADAAGGLRIDARACAPAGSAGTTETAGAERRDEPASPATVRLPLQVENDLWAAADAADEVSAQLRACQGWIRSNGFYGTASDEKHELLGRMVAAQNNDGEAVK
jgi:hypothetical protein